MTTSQYLLNAGLLGYILYCNLGTRRSTAQRFLLPVLLVAIAGFVFLKDLPTAGNDVALEIAGAGLGVGFGFSRRRRSSESTGPRTVNSWQPPARPTRRCGSPSSAGGCCSPTAPTMVRPHPSSASR